MDTCEIFLDNLVSEGWDGRGASCMWLSENTIFPLVENFVGFLKYFPPRCTFLPINGIEQTNAGQSGASEAAS